MASKTTQTTHAARPGFIGHTEFVSSDPQATREFLQEVAGLEFHAHAHPQGADYQVYSAEHRSGGAVRAVQRGLTSPTAVPYLEVEDLDEAESRVTASGGRIVVPRLDHGEGKGVSLVCQAPGGPLVGLWAPS